MDSSAPRKSYDLSELVLRPTTVVEVVDEAPDVKTFWLEGSLGSLPGQFVMLWSPQGGARPFSIHADDGDGFALTIAKIGEFTIELFKRKAGDQLGYFGPFGRPFTLEGKHIALVAGGYGAAPLSFLARRASEEGVGSELIIGARTGASLLYENSDYPAEVQRHYCTDDGSAGFTGTAPAKLANLIAGDETIDMVYTVGPELMMKEVVSVCDDAGVDCQISLERYMKCGFGICGSCCVDPLGSRMCMEGPIMSRAELREVSEFGVYHRGASGRKVYF